MTVPASRSRGAALLAPAAWLAAALAVTAGAVTPPAHAAGQRTFRGTVSHVTDGDTLWVRPASGGAALQVRLQGLDAPEICQAWGPQARDALARHVLRQPVTVRSRGKDTYGRLVARVERDRQDLGAWLVGSGMAWSYHWGRSGGPYSTLQDQARQARRGLWSQPQPMRPGVFRRMHGSCPHPAAS